MASKRGRHVMNMSENTKEDMVSLLCKINKARELVQACDWEKDKFLSYGGKMGYKYLSVEKMKRNLAPIFQKQGLELAMRFYDLQKFEGVGQMSQHWVVTLDVDIIDIATGASSRTTVYGEAGDSGDKGLSKAQTYALKQWMANEFLLIDGIDPDDGYGEEPVNKPFVPKTDRENEAVKSKVLENAAPVPKATPKPSTLPDSGEPTRPKTSAPVPKPPAPAKPMTPAEAALDKLKQEKIAQFTLTKPQENMINRIKEVWEERALKGEVTPEEYNTMSYDCATIGDNSEAVAFIKKYRVDE